MAKGEDEGGPSLCAAGVGKTSLVIRYVKDHFQEAETINAPMAEDHLEKTVSIDGKKCQLMIYDTGGQEPRLRPPRRQGARLQRQYSSQRFTATMPPHPISDI